MSKITEIVDIDKGEEEYVKQAYIVEGDELDFPRATINPKLQKLQSLVTEFITSVILKHEKEYYNLVFKMYKEHAEYLLGTTQNTIISTICTLTKTFYNKLYHSFQKNDQSNGSVKFIQEMVSYTDYGPHILLDKLFRITIDIHLDIIREELIVDETVEKPFDVYYDSLSIQLNKKLVSYNLLNALSKNDDDNDGQFIVVPDNHEVFDINIDKPLGEPTNQNQ